MTYEHVPHIMKKQKNTKYCLKLHCWIPSSGRIIQAWAKFM